MTYNKKIYIITTLILLLAIYNASDEGVIAQQAIQQKVQTIHESRKINYDQLSKNENWQELCKIWKILNHFDENYAHKGLDKQREQFTAINNALYKNIDPLKASNLLTEDEVFYIRNLIDTRLLYLERRYNLVMCRRMLPPVDVEQNLEKRFDVLERLYKDGKVNSETYTATKQKLVDDLKQLNLYDGRSNYKQNYLNLLLLLNK